MKTPIRVMIVDNHEVVRFGLRSLLTMYPTIEVIGEATNADESILLALQKRPDIILMDIRMPGKSGIDACREIKKSLPSTCLIMLTSYDDEDAIHNSILAGASGYILKEISSQELIHAIEAVAEGKSLLDPAITAKVLRKIRETAKEENELAKLTPQDKQVLSHIAKGKTNREIAELMMLSEKTIRNYVSQIFDKLSLHNRAEAAAFAVQHHLDK